MPRPKNWIKLERWKNIKGYDGKYTVSSMGRIRRNIQRDGRRTPIKDKGIRTSGRRNVHLGTKQSKIYLRSIPKLVCEHHLPWVPYKGLKDNTIKDYSIYNLIGGPTTARYILADKDVLEIKHRISRWENKRPSNIQLGKEYRVGHNTISMIDLGQRRIRPSIDGEEDLICTTCQRPIYKYSWFKEHQEDCGKDTLREQIKLLRQQLHDETTTTPTNTGKHHLQESNRTTE